MQTSQLEETSPRHVGYTGLHAQLAVEVDAEVADQRSWNVFVAD